jgi:CDP-diacylglycerol--glycerol-3-phosphate 3-phosphatidyltransferase
MRERAGRALNLPNALSVFRLAAAPGLLYLAWCGRPTAFLVLFAVSLLSDGLDGLLARTLDQASEIGTRLDSWADLATYLSAPLGAWWLWPELAQRELTFVVVAAAGFTAPLLAGLIKFGRLPSYHTWISKVSAVVIGVTAFVLIVLDIPLPFRIAVVLQVLAACEEFAITFVLPQWRSNIPTLWYALRVRRGAGTPPVLSKAADLSGAPGGPE